MRTAVGQHCSKSYCRWLLKPTALSIHITPQGNPAPLPTTIFCSSPTCPTFLRRTGWRVMASVSGHCFGDGLDICCMLFLLTNKHDREKRSISLFLISWGRCLPTGIILLRWCFFFTWSILEISTSCCREGFWCPKQRFITSGEGISERSTETS